MSRPQDLADLMVGVPRKPSRTGKSEAEDTAFRVRVAKERDRYRHSERKTV